MKSGARRILLILIRLENISLISKFVEMERAQDSQLPFLLAQLEKILDSRGTALDFFETQWSTIPVFFKENRTHRIYHQRMILPFLKPIDSLSEEGAFGEVSIVTLSGLQHAFRELGKSRVSSKHVFPRLKYILTLDRKTFALCENA